VEDAIAQAVVAKILRELQIPLHLEQVLQRKGRTYLEHRAMSLFAAAKGGVAIVLLADSDSAVCPIEIRKRWIGDLTHNSFVLRFAVREIEAWLLADHSSIAQFLRVSESRVPEIPEGLDDPKRALVELARRSKLRSVREALAPVVGGTAQVGPEYNVRLTSYVESEWSASRAASRAVSLDEFCTRLRHLSLSA
jgi:hypothetical protein